MQGKFAGKSAGEALNPAKPRPRESSKALHGGQIRHRHFIEQTG
jgi:hypothetical protein